MRVATLAITLVGVAAAHGADELPPAFAAVKEATVWVKARTADGRAGANVSGFVARVDKEHAWVVTDETAVRAVSAIGGRDGGRTLRPGATLTVVYRPGAKDEEGVPAAVAATGGVRGLVLLRLPLAKDQPAALKFGTAEDAPVGTPLYSFGGSGEVEPEKEKVPGWVMPLGVGRGTVTTTPAPGTADKLMTEVPEKGNVFHVGGPVVTRAGAVVGVGFMKFGVLGQSTPVAKVFDLVRPQMTGFTWEEAGVTPAGVKVRFVARFNDPFGTLTGATFRFKFVPVESGRPRPPRPPFVEDANVPPIDADWSLEVPVLANTATATITWKPGTDAKPLRYLAQVTYCDAKGVGQAGRVETVAVAFPPPGSAPPVAQLPDTGDLRIDAEYRPLGGATAATAMSEKERFLPTLVWERGGKAFFVATASGRLWKLGYPDLKPLGQLDLQGACTWLTASKAGVIATVTGRREAWVIDPGTLRLGRKFDIGESVRVASAPPLDVAFVGPGGTRSALTVYDLTAGKAVQEYLPADMKRRGAMFDDLAASPDGKFLFSANGRTAFSWQVKENEVLATDVTRGTADLLSGVRAGFGQFAFSAGGMVAAVGNGNPPANPEERGTGVNVYAVDDLSKLVLRIATGQHPKSLAVDPKTGDIYAHNSTTPLLLFDARGKPTGSHEFPFLPRHRTTHLSAHPDGGGVLVLTEAIPKQTGAITSVRFGRGAVAKSPLEPKSVGPKAADPTEYVRVGEMAVARLPLNRNETGLLPCMTWNRKATAFFTLSVTGELRRYTYPDLAADGVLKVGAKCGWLSPSAEGLIVTVPSKKEAWVVDPDTLKTIRTFGTDRAEWMVALPDGKLGYATGTGGPFGGLAVFDLATGKSLANYKPRDFAEARFRSFSHPVLSPDGKKLFTQSGGQFCAWDVDGKTVTVADKGESPRLSSGGSKALCVSPVKAGLVAMPTGGGNWTDGKSPAEGYQTHLFAWGDLTKPARTLTTDKPHQLAVGFDHKSGRLFSSDQEHPLLVFDNVGRPVKELRLPGPPGTQFHTADQFLVHPTGGRLLILSSYFGDERAQTVWSVGLPDPADK